MASSINHVTLLGNVGTDPEVREANGTKVARFRMAVSRKWTDKEGQRQEEVSWFGIKCFGQAASYVEQYIGKGMRLCLEGSLKEERWEKDGQKHSMVFVYAHQLVPFEPRAEGQPATAGAETTQRAAAATAPRGRQETARATSDPWGEDRF